MVLGIRILILAEVSRQEATNKWMQKELLFERLNKCRGLKIARRICEDVRCHIRNALAASRVQRRLCYKLFRINCLGVPYERSQ